ncbi:hypothetical protein [Lacisediminihabitans profunda]|uniref:Uncharacterized protein n=1 Tax=Lacisediminihabitans profunda TaxID=2594790 RepID=A0A5C8UM04_9MICO|nr:hypothetical protein [Lacisediminihabitans profunda]TXN29335.1 hypothetical protein FVP33_14260 [Lacisediminihabitans profunda]
MDRGAGGAAPVDPSVQRLVGFTNGVVAIAITLVALIVTVLFPATSLYPLVLIVLARPIKWLALRGAP